MSIPLGPNTSRPPLRQAACLIVGLGSLLTAGSVLSSVAKPTQPSFSAQAVCEPSLSYPLSVYAMPFVCTPQAHAGRPLQALVCVAGDTIQITNTSTDSWRAIRLEVNDSTSHCHRLRVAKLASYDTYTIPLSQVHSAAHASGPNSLPVFIHWQCQTPHGLGEWTGSVMP